MTSSPPPIENFLVTPVLKTGPYDYGSRKTLAIRQRLKQMTGDRPKEVGIPMSQAKSSTLFTDSGSTKVLEAEKDINDPSH